MKKVSLLASPMLFFLAVSAAWAGGIAPDLQDVMELQALGQEIPVIITLSDKADLSALQGTGPGLRKAAVIRSLKETAARTQAPIRSFLANRLGKNGHVRPLWIINAIAVTLPAQAVRELAGMPEVESIRMDAAFFPPEVRPASLPPPEWNLDLIRARELWSQGYTGQGMVVAVMDTGVDIDHPDLVSRWRGGENSWFDAYGGSRMPYDPDGHGTQVAGVILGGNGSGTSVGVAPSAQWIAAKIFDDTGTANLSAVHAAFQWALDPDEDDQTNDQPDIVNCSWGFDQQIGVCDGQREFEADIQALKAAGISVVFAAGNAGPAPSTDMSPANYPDGFAVGSVDDSMVVGGTSSRGPSSCDASIYPDVTAPGVDIYTCDLTAGGVILNSYGAFSGTSFATAHVSGAMALLKCVFPELGPEELEAALKSRGMDLGTTGPDNTYGYGMIDVAAAYQALSLQQPPPGDCFIRTAAGRDGGGNPGIFFMAIIAAAGIFLVNHTKGKRS